MAYGSSAGCAGDSQEFAFLYSPPDIAKDLDIEENERTQKGRKRKLDHANWQKKYNKTCGLRKNSPSLTITEDMECCCKKCLQTFGVSHLQRTKTNFESMLYEEQNIYLNGLLHRQETRKTSGHPRKTHPATSVNGRKLGRPTAEDIQFNFIYSIRNNKGINVHICQKAFCDVHGFGPKRLQVLRCKLGRGRART